ncbi:MAG: NADH-quinone oxidoreductase subunit J [Acidobacteria bacterium]|nr:NADH-quinone oxidoreductase subunit J [Acidobacteriota bacterium]
MEALVFYTLGAIALGAAVAVVAFRKVFYSALSLILCLTSVAGLYLLLEAPFMAAVQVIVYAGAIMVLFLFVIMLLDPFSGGVHPDKRKYLRVLGPALGSIMLLLLFPMLQAYDLAMAPRSPDASPEAVGSVENLAMVLFDQYLLPFEVTSVLILVAIIGVVVLAKRRT